jgi:hypothetical protein
MRSTHSVNVCLHSGKHVFSTVIPLDCNVTLTNCRSVFKIISSGQTEQRDGQTLTVSDCFSRVSISLATVAAKVSSIPLNEGGRIAQKICNRLAHSTLSLLKDFHVCTAVLLCIRSDPAANLFAY